MDFGNSTTRSDWVCFFWSDNLLNVRFLHNAEEVWPLQFFSNLFNWSADDHSSQALVNDLMNFSGQFAHGNERITFNPATCKFEWLYR
jgi:hypothetical protein